MSRTLFFGNLESPFIKEVIKTLVLSGKELVMSTNSIQILGEIKYGNKLINSSILTWSWNDTVADFHIQDAIVDLFPYLYPDTINPFALKKLLNVSQYPIRSYGSFRLGFGVQEELFDLFLAHIVEASELAYFDLISSLQLLNPVNQLEYRKNSYGFLRFIGKETLVLFEQKLQIKKYEIIRQIPFYESFSKKFGHPGFISYLDILK